MRQLLYQLHVFVKYHSVFLCCSDLSFTIFLFWYFSKFFKCLVFESSGEEETPYHPVRLPFAVCLSAVLSTWLSPSFLVCLTVSPPVFPIKVGEIINSVALPSPISAPC